MIEDKNNVKKDFPCLAHTNTAYLDTAATSQTPDAVIDAMDTYYKTFRANIHRGLYVSAETATMQYEGVREKVANFIGATKDEIIFTSGATASSNILTYALEQTFNLQAGDEIVLSEAEHHASLVPLQELARRKGLVLRFIPLAQDFDLDYAQAEALIGDKTKIVSVMLASNVTGRIFDVARIAEYAHKKGAIMITDATAAVGHIPVNVKKLGVDFLYFSGHKMCGPTGVGVLYGTKEKLATLHPSFFGGGMINHVYQDHATWASDVSRFEAGTPPIAEVIGLGAAIDYLKRIGVQNIHDNVRELISYATTELGNAGGVRLLCPKNANDNVGIVSFVIDGIHPHDIAQVLAKHDVAIRAGHHCAMPFMETLGVSATARASLYVYNSKEDVDRLIEGLHDVRQIFKK